MDALPTVSSLVSIDRFDDEALVEDLDLHTPSFGVFASERLHPPVSELRGKYQAAAHSDEFQLSMRRDASVIQLIEDAADLYLYRKSSRFITCVRKLYLHTRMHREYINAQNKNPCKRSSLQLEYITDKAIIDAGSKIDIDHLSANVCHGLHTATASNSTGSNHEKRTKHSFQSSPLSQKRTGPVCTLNGDCSADIDGDQDDRSDGNDGHNSDVTKNDQQEIAKPAKGGTYGNHMGSVDDVVEAALGEGSNPKVKTAATFQMGGYVCDGDVCVAADYSYDDSAQSSATPMRKRSADDIIDESASDDSECIDLAAVEQFTRQFVCYLLNAWNIYLGRGWDRTEELLQANELRKDHFVPKSSGSGLLDTIRESASQPQLFTNEPIPVRSFTDADMDEISALPVVLVLFYAHYCAACRMLEPQFIKAAGELRERVPCAMIDGSFHLRLKRKYKIKMYPTVMLLKYGEIAAVYPREGERTAGRLVEFALDAGQAMKRMRKVSSIASASVDPMDRWRRVRDLLYQKRVISQLRAKREFVSIIEKLRALGLNTEGDSEASAELPRDFSVDPPTIFFMGGGMGSGKSTVVEVLNKSPFWQKYGRHIVVIEADAIKMNDPVFQALNKTESAASAVHSYSVQIAEELFLAAIRQRKDIVFDGTMMWRPFVEQTVAMVKDVNHLYKRGPGVITNEDGSVTERYWEIVSDCETPQVPYRLELIGVTSDAETAVRRAIVRQVVTGRGVPVTGQLQSHKLFSEAFPAYVPLFCNVTLYDNNSPDLLLTDEPVEPRLIAQKQGRDAVLVVDEDPYERFLAKKHINVSATSAELLYPEEFKIRRHCESEDGCTAEELEALAQWLKTQLFE